MRLTKTAGGDGRIELVEHTRHVTAAVRQPRFSWLVHDAPHNRTAGPLRDMAAEGLGSRGASRPVTVRGNRGSVHAVLLSKGSGPEPVDRGR